MRPKTRSSIQLALLCAASLCGCGKAGTIDRTPATSILFKSSAIKGGYMPARYTCDGKDAPPPMEWGAVPPGTKELVLAVLGINPTGANGSYSISVEWVVAGLNPALHRLTGGHLPHGAHLGVTTHGNSTRYLLCPAKGITKQYQFTLYAVPPNLTVPKGFTGIEILSLIGSSDAQDPSKAQGAFTVLYKRKGH